MGREKIVFSKVIYSGRLLRMILYEVESDGKRYTREVVEHPGAVAVVPVKNNGMIVLVKQFRMPVGKEMLEIPAGTKKKNETAPNCARRELIEETGYAPTKLKRLADFYVSPGYSTEKIRVYVAEGLKKADWNPEVDESIRILEVPLRKIEHMIKMGEINDSKSIIGLKLFLDLFPKSRGHNALRR